VTPIRHRVACLALTATCALLIPSQAPAHIDRSRSLLYWEHASKDLHNHEKELDPITIFWAPADADAVQTHYRPMDFENLTNEVEENWRGRPSHGQMNHGQICLGQDPPVRAVKDGRQNLTFRSNNGSGNRFASTWFQESTDNKCRTQWHMRFWNDELHDEITSGHGDTHQWGLSGVHRDIQVCPRNLDDCKHKISGRWAKYRVYAVKRAMVLMCTRSRWRMVPGADRKFQGHSHDGYMGIVKGQHRDCPNSLE
jgi:hypothetical protein